MRGVGDREHVGFTLVELIAVIAICVMCGALAKVAYTYRTDSIKTNIVKEELALLNCALESYKSDHGSYPVAASKSMSDNARVLYESLAKYLESVGGGRIWKTKGGMLMDPWDNCYSYLCVSPEAVEYTLFSIGPNGHVDEDVLIDDIYSR